MLYMSAQDTVIALWAGSSPHSFSVFVTLIMSRFFSLAHFFSVFCLHLSFSLCLHLSVFFSFPLWLLVPMVTGLWCVLFCCYGNWPTVGILLSDLGAPSLTYVWVCLCLLHFVAVTVVKHTVKRIVHKWSSSHVGLKLIDGEEMDKRTEGQIWTWDSKSALRLLWSKPFKKQVSQLLHTQLL